MDRPHQAVSSMFGHVLIVDDHPLFAEALALAVTDAFASVQTRVVASVARALDVLAEADAPYMILLDLDLPDANGLSGFEQIRAAAPDMPILVVSAWASDETIQDLVHRGAAGFMRKEDSADVLQQAMLEVARGLVFTSDAPRVAPPDAANDDLAQRLAGLTRQQTRIMHMICDGKPNKQIAYEMSLAEASVKAHVTALLRRLGLRTRTQVAVMARRAGVDNESSRAATG